MTSKLIRTDEAFLLLYFPKIGNQQVIISICGYLPNIAKQSCTLILKPLAKSFTWVIPSRSSNVFNSSYCMWEKLEGNQYIESLYWQELKVINREKQLLLETRKAASNAIFNPKRYNTTLQGNFLKNFTTLTNYVEIWYVIGPLCLVQGKHENAKYTKKQDVLMALQHFFS